MAATLAALDIDDGALGVTTAAEQAVPTPPPDDSPNGASDADPVLPPIGGRGPWASLWAEKAGVPAAPPVPEAHAWNFGAGPIDAPSIPWPAVAAAAASEATPTAAATPVDATPTAPQAPPELPPPPAADAVLPAAIDWPVTFTTAVAPVDSVDWVTPPVIPLPHWALAAATVDGHSQEEHEHTAATVTAWEEAPAVLGEGAPPAADMTAPAETTPAAESSDPAPAVVDDAATSEVAVVAVVDHDTEDMTVVGSTPPLAADAAWVPESEAALMTPTTTADDVSAEPSVAETPAAMADAAVAPSDAPAAGVPMFPPTVPEGGASLTGDEGGTPAAVVTAAAANAAPAVALAATTTTPAAAAPLVPSLIARVHQWATSLWPSPSPAAAPPPPPPRPPPGISPDHPVYVMTVAPPPPPLWQRLAGGTVDLAVKSILLYVAASTAASLWRKYAPVTLSLPPPGSAQPGGGGASAALGGGPPGAAYAPKEFTPGDGGATGTTFADVKGCDEAKAELVEIVEYLKNPKKFTRLGGKLPKGVLLTGPPGTGKTLLAKAVAGEAGVPFLFRAGSEFEEMFVGVGSRRVRTLFAAAKKKAPCIVFIDEIDAIGASRRSWGEGGHSRKTLNQLLVEMDGFEATEGIIVLAATNMADTLDPALMRPGRFDRHVAVPPPDARGRQQILEHYLRGKPVAGDVDVNRLARGTVGFTGADLANLVNQAAVQSAMTGAELITPATLEFAKDKILMGAERASAFISEANKKVTAYHEAGHALVAIRTPGAHPVYKATIMPRGSILGMVQQLPTEDETSVSKKQLLARMDVCMGGRVAEELVFGKDEVTTGARSDLKAATRLATHMVAECGMSDKLGPVFVDMDEPRQGRHAAGACATVESEVESLLAASYERVKGVVTANMADLVALANALIEQETLTGEQVNAVLAASRAAREGGALPAAAAEPTSPAVDGGASGSGSGAGGSVGIPAASASRAHWWGTAKPAKEAVKAPRAAPSRPAGSRASRTRA